MKVHEVEACVRLYHQHNDLNVPFLIYGNPRSMACRATLARLMMRQFGARYLGQCCELMDSAVSYLEVHRRKGLWERESVDEDYLAWCLDDLAVWQNLYGNSEQALVCVDRALRWADDASYIPFYSSKGLIWYHRLRILNALKHNDAADAESLQMCCHTWQSCRIFYHVYHAQRRFEVGDPSVAIASLLAAAQTLSGGGEAPVHGNISGLHGDGDSVNDGLREHIHTQSLAIVDEAVEQAAAQAKAELVALRARIHMNKASLHPAYLKSEFLNCLEHMITLAKLYAYDDRLAVINQSKGRDEMLKKLHEALAPLRRYAGIEDKAVREGLIYLVCRDLKRHFTFYIPNPKNRAHAARVLEHFPGVRLLNEAIPNTPEFSLFQAMKHKLVDCQTSVEPMVDFLRQHAIIVEHPTQPWMKEFERMIEAEHVATGKGNGRAFSRANRVFKNFQEQHSVVGPFEQALIARLEPWLPGLERMDFDVSQVNSVDLYITESLHDGVLFPTRQSIEHTMKLLRTQLLGRVRRLPVLDTRNLAYPRLRLYLDHRRYGHIFRRDREADRNPRKRPASTIKAVNLSVERRAGAPRALRTLSVGLTTDGYRHGELEMSLRLTTEQLIHECIYEFWRETR